MSSIFTSVSSAVSSIGQGIYNLYDRAVCYCSKTPPAKIAIIMSKINAQNSSLHNLSPEELTDIAENLDYFKLPLIKRIELAHELVNHRLISILAKSKLLSYLSEKDNFQIAKKIVKNASVKEGYGAGSFGALSQYEINERLSNSLAKHIDKFKPSENHRFFLVKKLIQIPFFGFVENDIEKFCLPLKRILEIEKRSLHSNNNYNFNSVLSFERIRFYFNEKSSSSKSADFSSFEDDIAIIAQRIIKEKFASLNVDISSLKLSLEDRERIVEELLKSKNGISFLSETIDKFDLPLKKREEIANFLLRNNFKEILFENIYRFKLSHNTKLKIINNQCLKNKNCRIEILRELSSFHLSKNDAEKIYKKYLSIELLDWEVLENFRELELGTLNSQVQILSKNPFYIKNKRNNNISFDCLLSISFYFEYLSKELALSEQNQMKLLEIFNSISGQSNSVSSELLFRFMFLFLSKIALSKAKDLSFLDDKNFFINMILSLSEIKQDTKTKFLKDLEKHKKTLLKDSRNYEPLITLLSLLCEKHLNKHSSIDNFLNQIFDPRGKESPVERFKLILAFVNLNLQDQINKENYISLKELIKILAKQLFIELDIEEDFQAFEANIFYKLRDVSALFTYLGKINTLDKEDQIKMKASLKAIVISMLNGTYEKYRKDSPHLKELLKKDKKYEALINEWLKEGSIEVIQTTDATDEKEKAQNVRFFEFLKLKLITDKHLSNLQELFPTLSSILRNDFNLAALNEASNIIRQKIQTAISSHNNKALINLKAEDALLTACSKPKCSIDEVLRLIQIAFPTVNNQKLQLVLDIEDFIKTLSKKDETLKDCVFSISGGMSDLLLLGKETGGCQNVDGEASLNKHLLGYADGKNQIWSIKNKDGQLIARAVARLLYSEKRKAPVIFLERVYSLNPNKAFEEALIKHAKIRAKELKLPLLITGNVKTEPLSSWGSSAPFEYCDGALEHQTKGTYTITDTEEIS